MLGRRLISFVTVSLLVLGACRSSSGEKSFSGNDDRSSGSTPSAALTTDEKACEDFYRAELRYMGRCGGILNGSPSAVARFRKLCSRQLVARGAESVRDARASCVERLKTAACDADLPECELPAGTLDDGEPCAGPEQCKSRRCKLTSSGCGTCAQRVAPGGDCSSPADCASGKDEVASCDYEQGARTGKCSVWKIAKAGQSCSATVFCDVKSHCAVPDENAKSGTCLPNLAVGEACDDTRACRPGLVCTKQKCAAKPKEGDACDAINACDDGLACDGTCKAVLYVYAGEKCDAVRGCATGRCVPPSVRDPDGRTTSSGAAATCVPPIPDGKPCSEDQAARGEVCDLFARCIDGKCMLEDPESCD